MVCVCSSDFVFVRVCVWVFVGVCSRVKMCACNCLSVFICV